jgi:phage gp36-like protein
LLWKTKASEEVRQRYEDAISFLERVSVGRGILTIKIINESGEEETAIADTSPKTMPIGTTYKGGVFSDSILDNMPSI